MNRVKKVSKVKVFIDFFWVVLIVEKRDCRHFYIEVQN